MKKLTRAIKITAIILTVLVLSYVIYTARQL